MWKKFRDLNSLEIAIITTYNYCCWIKDKIPIEIPKDNLYWQQNKPQKLLFFMKHFYRISDITVWIAFVYKIFKLHVQPISSSCSYYIPSENIRKSFQGSIKWDKEFKSVPSKIFGRHPLKETERVWSTSVFRKFYLVHSWVLWLKREYWPDMG